MDNAIKNATLIDTNKAI